jgi:hypothetical protein
MTSHLHREAFVLVEIGTGNCSQLHNRLQDVLNFVEFL